VLIVGRCLRRVRSDSDAFKVYVCRTYDIHASCGVNIASYSKLTLKRQLLRAASGRCARVKLRLSGLVNRD
jgi:hypothetical protein